MAGLGNLLQRNGMILRHEVSEGFAEAGPESMSTLTVPPSFSGR